MATRFYFDSTNAPAVSPAAISAEWEHSNQNQIRRLNKDKGSSALTTNATTYDSADHILDWDAIHYQFVSLPLAAQTIAAQTLTIVVKILESHASNNLFLTWKVFLIKGDGTLVAGATILAIRRDGTEPTTSLLSRTDAATSTSVSAPSQSRIVVELGLGGLPTSGSGINEHDGSIRVGDAAATDFAASDGLITDLNPWLEFANTLTFETQVAVDPAAETDTVQAITAQKLVPAGQVSEAETVFGITIQKLVAVGQVSETETVFGINRPMSVAVEQVSETDTGPAITAQKWVAVGPVAETETVFGIAIQKLAAVGQAAETSSVFAIMIQKTVTVGQAPETDTVFAITLQKRVPVGQVSETDLEFALTARKLVPVQPAAEFNTVFALLIGGAVIRNPYQKTRAMRIKS